MNLKTKQIKCSTPKMIFLIFSQTFFVLFIFILSFSITKFIFSLLNKNFGVFSINLFTNFIKLIIFATFIVFLTNFFEKLPIFKNLLNLSSSQKVFFAKNSCFITFSKLLSRRNFSRTKKFYCVRIDKIYSIKKHFFYYEITARLAKYYCLVKSNTFFIEETMFSKTYNCKIITESINISRIFKTKEEKLFLDEISYV